MNKLKFLFESNLFGVCTRIGEKLNFSVGSIRRYFIYASFFTLGSPVVIYLFLAFWMEIRKNIRRAQNPTVWEF
ncbi:MAG: PspC family transcriptional regulator [Cytophagaceae bacterium]|jgi:phage shock protein PspC (stress-responsive transcriptional regulator)|nr:PspC family transcriptional regulator [Cytophagaceae bacterium]MBK9932935.1 PspC family transcriptional regulator [Cytophagaceae bacterium]MBL0303354.1 PspC family transcriptional regulator [Cytophagaceae bacterium]MBL0326203.1 PspC family transcriptional regulator [Cytophagaceae bacterium]MCA0363631.1 PspC family transcriptional regulator [Bacteroidota bacterium]